MQPSLVALGPNRFLAYLRSRDSDFIYSSTSTDGCSWSTAKPTELPNNDSSVEAKRLKDGHLIMAFNNSNLDRSDHNAPRGLRKPLTVAISEDEGASWAYVRDLERGRNGLGITEQQIKVPGREEYSFPTICQLADGTILVAYNYRRQTIKVVAFREDWVRANSTVGRFQGQAATPKTMQSSSPP